ncbi:hypothetical protein TVAG_363930 [Trichomonas vaginalis G3]|uniref:Ankyrin repeat protein n=1 Tax=Trichomonas vaginalis (strain ATCC PRA-98 / G3) TaxID=412133 RepID=A2EDW2_TRIV3|nr:Ankyrin repeat family [Trichomonas vaginalis G3]EAY09178.1 hypothetical protein TVAG_363930 [Trichomonas vaginalis G3]KAI5487034.1 Ankyrin repeat family [Trichomonas vaginalis G3]|eukprot:XP_001321401.1 hypothetical protein [Trichomonas vaginalis G3]
MAKLIIEKGADINKEQYLYIVSEDNKLSMAQLLISHGAELNEKMLEQVTLLFILLVDIIIQNLQKH